MQRFTCRAGSALLVAVALLQTVGSAEPTAEARAGAVHLSKKFFSTLFGHPVDDSQPVRQRIKGALTRGTSQIKGVVTVELHSEAGLGRMDIRLLGNVNIDDAVATQNNVHVCSRSATEVDVRKSVVFAGDGLRHEPAAACCSTKIRICNVQASGPLAKRFAARRSHRELNDTQCIVAGRTKRSFEDRLNKRIGTAVDDLDAQLRERLRYDLLRSEVQFVSTDEHLRAWVPPQSDRRMAPPPQDEYLDAAFDVHVVLHEQVIEELAEYRFGGRRVHDEEIRNGVQAWCGSLPEPLREDAQQPRWSWKMASQPLATRFADGQIQLVLRLEDFQAGSNVLTGPIQAQLKLRPDLTTEGPRLLRVAEPVIEVDKSIQTVAVDTAQQLVDLLREKIGGIFPADLCFDAQPASDNEMWNKLQQLATTRLNVAEEWFEMGFQFETGDSDEPPSPE